MSKWKVIIVAVAAFVCGVVFVASCGSGGSGSRTNSGDRNPRNRSFDTAAEDVGRAVNDLGRAVGEVLGTAPEEIHVADAHADTPSTTCASWKYAVINLTTNEAPAPPPGVACIYEGGSVKDKSNGVPCGLVIPDGWEPIGGAYGTNNAVLARKCAN